MVSELLLAYRRIAQRNLPLVVVGTLILVGLYLISESNYLFFHVLVELFSVVTAVTTFVLTWNARRILKNGYLLFIGISFLFIGAIDLVHTMAFRGMGIFPEVGANMATQLWLAARFTQGLSLVIAPFFLRRRFEPFAVLVVFMITTTLLFLSIFYWGIFPLSYAELTGLTSFKVISEYIIILAYGVGMALLLRIRRAFDIDVLALLLLSMAAGALAELAFTEYLGVFDLMNLAGHYLKVVSFYLIYKAIIETGFIKPQDLLYRELIEREQALRESEVRERTRAAQLEAIMDAVPAAVWIANDRDASYVTGNRAAAEVLRMNPGENLSLSAPYGQAPVHFRVLKDGRELAPHELPLQISAASGRPVRDFEETVEFENGDRLHLLGNVTPLVEENGQPAGAVAAFVDITARVEAEQALQKSAASLRESEQRFRSLFETMAEGFSLCQIEYNEQGQAVDFRFLEINPAFERMTGLRREDTVGMTLQEILPDAFPFWFEQFTYVIDTGETLRSEYYSSSLNRYFEVFAYRTGEGLVASLIIDVTERRRHQESVREYALQLERSNRELQDFAFVASHDLQEPLRKIQAFGERLNSLAHASLDGEAKDYIQRMVKASMRMRTMIDDLLSLSRVTTRGRPFERVDLETVMQQVLSDLELRVEKSEGQVSFSDLPVVEADATQMHQLLQNLVGNALKFHRPGVPPIVRVYGECSQDGRQVSIYVEDNGVGFDEQYHDRIFQPFQRLHGRNEYEGSGIGLAVCRKIVERHGGSIAAKSIPGQGTTFAVTLPARQPTRRDNYP